MRLGILVIDLHQMVRMTLGLGKSSPTLRPPATPIPQT